MAHKELATESHQSTQNAELENDLEDFERDELLSTLPLEEWFATAERGVPIWCY